MEQLHLNKFDSDIYFVQIFRFTFDTKLLWFENVTIAYRPTYVVVYKSKNLVSILNLVSITFGGTLNKSNFVRNPNTSNPQSFKTFMPTDIVLN